MLEKLQQIEFILTSLSWGDSLQPGELEQAQDNARELIKKLIDKEKPQHARRS